MLLELSVREANYTLAAIRFYQACLTDPVFGVQDLIDEIDDIATDAGDDSPTPEDLDAIADKVNR